MTCETASWTVVVAVSTRSSGRSGGSYGASTPVKPFISPARARDFNPGEGRTYIDSVDYSRVLADLRERLAEWMVSTDDPLLRGPIAPPVGARINSQSQRSAEEPTQIVADVNAPTAR